MPHPTNTRPRISSQEVTHFSRSSDLVNTKYYGETSVPNKQPQELEEEEMLQKPHNKRWGGANKLNKIVNNTGGLVKLITQC